MHLGIDVGSLHRPDVRAATSGTVTAVGWLSGYEGYGNVVFVDAGSGYSLLYAHLSASDVVPGQWLAVGERDRSSRVHRLLHGHAPALRIAARQRARRPGPIPPCWRKLSICGNRCSARNDP